MHETCLRADDLGEVGEERDDVVFDLGFDGIDPRNVEFGRLPLFPDLFGGVLRNDAELRHRVGGVCLDFEPDAEFGFRRPDRGHLGAGIARNHRAVGASG